MTFKKITQWFIYSSNNPQRTTLILKGFLPLLALLGLGQFTEDFDSLIGVSVNFIVLLGQFIALSATTHGIVRKLWNTATVRA